MVDFTFAPLCTPGSPYDPAYAVSVVPGQPLPLFPMLMPEGWQHAPTQLKRPLYTGTQLRSLPDVALVYLVPTPDNGMPNIAWVRSERVEALGATVADFERVATYNVTRRPAAWAITQFGPGLEVAVCDNDYLAAERIVDPAFLVEAARKLGDPAATLMVGIPTRGLFVATIYRQSQEVGVFGQSIGAMYNQARNKPLCPWPFLVEAGRITAALEVS